MSRAAMLAEYLRDQARWRADKASQYGDDRNTRAERGLLDAAAYVEQLPDTDSRLGPMAAALYFDTSDMLVPGDHGGRVVRTWFFHEHGSPDQFLDALARAAYEDADELLDQLS